MTASPARLSALILGIPNPVSMGIARGWMMAGHAIASVWYPQRLRTTSAFRQDRELSRQAPGVTLHGLEERARVVTRAVPRLAGWPDAVLAAQRLKPDVVLSLLYPDRIPADFLAALPERVFNLHPSLLPAYRGPDPVLNMLWDRTIRDHGGLTLHLVSPEFDRGDELARRKVPFPPDLNLSAYYMHLVKAGSELLSDALPSFLGGTLNACAQGETIGAPQGRRTPQEAVLTADLTTSHVEWLCRTIPQMTALRVDGLPPHFIVTGYAGAGARAQTPPDMSDGVASFDVRDGRVSVRVAADPTAPRT